MHYTYSICPPHALSEVRAVILHGLACLIKIASSCHFTGCYRAAHGGTLIIFLSCTRCLLGRYAPMIDRLKPDPPRHEYLSTRHAGPENSPEP